MLSTAFDQWSIASVCALPNIACRRESPVRTWQGMFYCAGAPARFERRRQPRLTCARCRALGPRRRCCPTMSAGNEAAADHNSRCAAELDLLSLLLAFAQVIDRNTCGGGTARIAVGHTVTAADGRVVHRTDLRLRLADTCRVRRPAFTETRVAVFTRGGTLRGGDSATLC